MQSLLKPTLRIRLSYSCFNLLTTLSPNANSGHSKGWEAPHGVSWELLHGHSAEDIGTGRATKLGLLLQSFCHEQRCYFFSSPSFKDSAKSPSLILQEIYVLPSPQDLGMRPPFYSAYVIIFHMQERPLGGPSEAPLGQQMPPEQIQSLPSATGAEHSTRGHSGCDA